MRRLVGLVQGWSRPLRGSAVLRAAGRQHDRLGGDYNRAQVHRAACIFAVRLVALLKRVTNDVTSVERHVNARSAAAERTTGVVSQGLIKAVRLGFTDDRCLFFLFFFSCNLYPFSSFLSLNHAIAFRQLSHYCHDSLI